MIGFRTAIISTLALMAILPASVLADYTYGGVVNSLEYDIDSSRAIAHCMLEDPVLLEEQPEEKYEYPIKVTAILKRSQGFPLEVGQEIGKVQLVGQLYRKMGPQYVYFFKGEDTSEDYQAIRSDKPSVPMMLLGDEIYCYAVDMHEKAITNFNVLLKQIELRVADYPKSRPTCPDWVCTDGFQIISHTVDSYDEYFDFLVPPDPAMEYHLKKKKPTSETKWLLYAYYPYKPEEEIARECKETTAQVINDIRKVEWYLALERERDAVPPNHVNLLRDKRMIFSKSPLCDYPFNWYFNYFSDAGVVLKKTEPPIPFQGMYPRPYCGSPLNWEDSHYKMAYQRTVTLHNTRATDKDPTVPFYTAKQVRSQWFFPPTGIDHPGRYLIWTSLNGSLTVYDLDKREVAWSHDPGYSLAPIPKQVRFSYPGTSSRFCGEEVTGATPDGKYIFQSLLTGEMHQERGVVHLNVWELTTGRHVLSYTPENSHVLWECKGYLPGDNPEMFISRSKSPSPISAEKPSPGNVYERRDLKTGDLLPWDQAKYEKSETYLFLSYLPYYGRNQLAFIGYGLIEHARKVWNNKHPETPCK